ncbi:MULTISPECIES: hypothetical protein [Thermomonosporaceae]|uniref:hypothetical protein n=1 Tax=Thermomonosporaceae TaxID=2012 RepID=UPI00255B2A43|nr:MULTISPECIES: hypothetical protein [Thermomonosporaceae]MDL4774818.1 hypothetical protein [Actinomadura xylanilytica]
MTTVAHTCGWSTASAFIAVFRRVFGHTPGTHQHQCPGSSSRVNGPAATGLVRAWRTTTSGDADRPTAQDNGKVGNRPRPSAGVIMR